MMHFKYIVYLILLVGFHHATNCFAQDVTVSKSKSYFAAEIAYGTAIGQIKLDDLSYKVPYDGYAVRLRLSGGVFITDQLALGLGIGLDGYHNISANTAPLFIEGRYFLSPKPASFFISSNFGYAVPLRFNFENGFLGALAIGKKINTKRICWMPSVSLNAQQITDFNYFGYDPSSGLYTFYKDSVWLKTANVSLTLFL